MSRLKTAGIPAQNLQMDSLTITGTRPSAMAEKSAIQALSLILWHRRLCQPPPKTIGNIARICLTLPISNNVRRQRQRTGFDMGFGLMPADEFSCVELMPNHTLNQALRVRKTISLALGKQRAQLAFHVQDDADGSARQTRYPGEGLHGSLQPECLRHASPPHTNFCTSPALRHGGYNRFMLSD